MNVPGFTLLLQEFCSYCPDFEPEVEKIDCSSLTGLTEQVKYCTNIRCAQGVRCARLATNIRKQVTSDAKA